VFPQTTWLDLRATNKGLREGTEQRGKKRAKERDWTGKESWGRA